MKTFAEMYDELMSGPWATAFNPQRMQALAYEEMVNLYEQFKEAA